MDGGSCFRERHAPRPAPTSGDDRRLVPERTQFEHFFARVLSTELFPEICLELNAVRTGEHGAQTCAGMANAAPSLRDGRTCLRFASRTPSASSFLIWAMRW